MFDVGEVVLLGFEPEITSDYSPAVERPAGGFHVAAVNFVVLTADDQLPDFSTLE